MLSDIWERRLGVVLFALLATQAVLATLLFGGVGGLTQGILLLLGGTMSFVWLILAVGRPAGMVSWPLVAWWVVACLCYLTFRYQSAEIEYVARREWLLFVLAGSQFLVGLDLFTRWPESRRWMICMLAGLATLVGLLACWQFFSGISTVLGVVRPSQYGSRGSGTFINPNHFAASMEVALFPMLAWLFLGRMGVVGRLFLGYAVLVVAVGILVSVSRGAYVATTVGFMLLLVFLLCLKTKRRLALILLGCWLVAGFTLVMKSSEVRTRLVHITKVVERSDDDARLKIWRSTWALYQEQPIWGVGPGHFEFRYFKFRSPHYQQSAVRAHNDWLNILVDYGLVGGALVFVMFITLGIALGQRAWRYLRAGGEGLDGRSARLAIAFGAGLSLMVLALHSLVDFLIYIPALFCGIALLAALLLVPGAGNERSSPTAIARLLRWFQLIVVTAMALPMGIYGWRLLQESRELRQAKSLESLSSARVECYQRAVQIEPGNDWTRFLIGDHFRFRSALGEETWEADAKLALEYFEEALQANPYRYDTWLRKGYCLDWLGRHAEAEQAFKQALSLDPNGANTMAWVGWHWVQVGEYQKAIDQFLRSLNHLPAEKNPLAVTYLRHARDRINTGVR